MTVGSFRLWPLDQNGRLIDYPAPTPGTSTTADGGAAGPQPAGGQQAAAGQQAGGAQQAVAGAAHTPIGADPARPEAVDIYFGVRSDVPGPIPKDQVDLQDKVQKVLRTVQVLYRGHDPQSERNRRQFRNYYLRLYRLAQVGLEGESVSPDIAAGALAIATADLIDDEASNVKRKHMCILGEKASTASAGCLAVYVFLRLASAYWTPVTHFLTILGIDASLLANFMLLLIGCFVGVWLSYGIRTTTFTLSDLTIMDADRLTPVIRLVFAGILTVILGIIFTIPLVEVTIGQTSVTSIGTYPILAFVVGCFCGISELALPAVVAKRASDFIQNIR